MSRVALAAVAAVVAVGLAGALDFDADEHLSEETARAAWRIALTTAESSLDKTVGSVVVVEAMNRAWWDLTNDVVESFREKKIDLTTKVHQHARSLKRQLTSLSDGISAHKRSKRGIPPAFQWAQSPDYVYLNIKFSAKWDTPATLGCELDAVTFPQPNFVIFAANCPRSGKRFELKLELFGDVDVEGSSWNLQSVGRASFNIKKASKAVWPRMLKSRSKPGNLHVWWTLKEKYEKENSNFSAQNKRPTPAPDAPVDPAPPAPDATPAPEAASTPAPTPTPTQDPLTAALASLASKHRGELDAVSAERKARVSALEEEAKVTKANADRVAGAAKAAAQERLDAARKEVDKEVAQRRAELRKAQEEERAAAREQHTEL